MANNNNLDIGLWDIKFYKLDENGNELTNKDGSVKLFTTKHDFPHHLIACLINDNRPYANWCAPRTKTPVLRLDMPMSDCGQPKKYWSWSTSQTRRVFWTLDVVRDGLVFRWPKWAWKSLEST